MVGMNPPHSPYRSLDDCMEEDFNLYKNQPLDSLLVRPNADSKMLKAESARYYFASVTGVDRAFGQILDALKELGLDKNTIVVFASDHGETMCSQHTEDPKNSPYSESMNVPFLVRFPDKIKPRVDDLMLSSPDIMPTLLGLAGLADSIPAEVQGRNYAPFSSMKRRILYVPPALSTSRTWTVRRMRKAWSVPTSLRRAALNRRATRWRSTLTAKTISWSKVCCLTMKRTRIR